MLSEFLLVAIGTIVATISTIVVFRSTRDSLLFKLSVIAFLVLWVVIPGATSLILHEVTDLSIKPEFAKLYFIESSIVFLGVALSLFHKRRFYSDSNLGINRITFSVIACLYGYYLFTLEASNYIDSNDISRGLESGIFPFFISIVGAYIIYVALVTKSVILLLTSNFLLIVFVVISIASGGRIILLLPLFIIVYRVLDNGKLNTNNVAKVAILVVVLSLSIFVSIGSETRRSEVAALSFTDIEAANIDLIVIIGSLFQKFNGYDTGATLIEGYGAGEAGIKPYLGAFLFPIPRAIYPDKPIAGSISDSRAGTPSRLVPNLSNPYDTVNNVGVSPLAVSVWHWGWITGSIMFGACGYLSLLLFRKLLGSRSMLLRSVAISLIPIPGFINVFPSPDVFVKNAVTFVVFYILVRIFGHFRFRRIPREYLLGKIRPEPYC